LIYIPSVLPFPTKVPSYPKIRHYSPPQHQPFKPAKGTTPTTPR